MSEQKNDDISKWLDNNDSLGISELKLKDNATDIIKAKFIEVKKKREEYDALWKIIK